MNTQRSSISTAIVPAAGLGSRMRPLSDAVPKELLPLGRRTALQHLVRELVAAGIRRIVFVTSPPKEAVLRGAFGDRDAESGAEIDYAIQSEMRGLGDAILQAHPKLRDDHPFLVALGDAVMSEPKSGGLTARLIRACSSDCGMVGLAVQKVPREKLSRYGIVDPAATQEAGADFFPIRGIVEKPAPESAPSEYAAAARYVLPWAVFDTLRGTAADAKGEVQLTDALRALLAAGHHGAAVPLRPGETRHDIGGFDSYYRAFIQFALADGETGASLRLHLKSLLSENKEHVVE